jgi:hypothetical protein
MIARVDSTEIESKNSRRLFGGGGVGYAKRGKKHH